MPRDSEEFSPEFLTELKGIIKIIIEKYHLKCTGIEARVYRRAKYKRIFHFILSSNTQFRTVDMPGFLIEHKKCVKKQ